LSHTNDAPGSGGGGGAPTDADYLVGTADPDLSNEIAVGTTPGGELGGTWASPTVDATHSGSAHHADSHTVASHSDTTATGAELEELTDGSTTVLHAHTGGSGDVAADAIWDAKGDLAVGTGADTAVRLAVGSNDQVLTADSATATGLKWAAAAGGGGVESGTYSGDGNASQVISTTLVPRLVLGFGLPTNAVWAASGEHGSPGAGVKLSVDAGLEANNSAATNTSLSADGSSTQFTAHGSGARGMNKSGITYHYVAFS